MIGSLCLGVTAFGWALNWPLMKLLLQQWPPLFARGLAGVAAALILIGIAKARGQPLEVPRKAVPRLLPRQAVACCTIDNLLLNVAHRFALLWREICPGPSFP